MNRCLLSALLLLAACAQVREPAGGARDESPPQLVAAEPPSGTVRFNGTTIQLSFDERIDLRKVRENLLVSPPMDPAPEVIRSGPRDVRIDLKASLAPNTTYVLNLGQALVDLTEGNPWQDLVHVLGTGDRVDSLELKGIVRHAYTGAAEGGVQVLLYPEGDTSAFTSGRPLYVARSDADGHYRLHNLAPGSYTLRALRDLNGDLRHDLPAEEIAFATGTVVLPGDSAGQILRLYREPGPTPQVMDERVLPEGALQLVFSRPVDSLVLDAEPGGPRPGWLQEWCTGRDTLLAWPLDTTLLHGTAVIVRPDGALPDTVTYRRPLRPVFTLALSAGAPTPRGVPLHAGRPVERVDTDRIVAFGPGADSVRVTVDRDNNDQRMLVLRAEGPGTASILLKPKAVRDIVGGWNDSLVVAMRAAQPGAFGTLALTFADPLNTPLIALLQDAQGRVVRRQEVRGDAPSVTWEGLTGGRYTIRVIRDANGNGRWDPGRWREQLPPEEVLTHPDPVNVRAGWDVDVNWILP